MNKAAAIFQTSRYETIWGEGDSEPRPGFEFSSDLLDQLKLRRVSSPIDTFGDDSWGHANWYFWITYQDREYSVYIHCHFEDFDPPLWMVQVVERIGFWRTIFGSTSRTSLLEETLLTIVIDSFAAVTNVEHFEWMATENANDQFYGALG